MNFDLQVFNVAVFNPFGYLLGMEFLGIMGIYTNHE